MDLFTEFFNLGFDGAHDVFVFRFFHQLQQAGHYILDSALQHRLADGLFDVAAESYGCLHLHAHVSVVQAVEDAGYEHAFVVGNNKFELILDFV